MGTQLASDTEMSDRFASLGAPIRLRMVRLLVRAGDDGLAVGELQRKLDLPASTHSHHLGALVQAGLVRQDRRGREVICTADFSVLREVGAYLIDQCCADTPAQESAA